MNYPNHTQQPAKKSRIVLIAVLVAFTVAAACICGVAVATSSGDKKPGAPAATASAGQATAATTQAAPPTTPAQPTAVAAPANPTITDGTWTVGEDFPAGTYKTTGAGSNCYWAIYKSGQNQSFDAMVDNHLGGGNLRVTLKAGQDFETKRCGTWAKA